MSRTMTNATRRILKPQESAYVLMPWSCNHFPTFSEIEAYLPITGQFERSSRTFTTPRAWMRKLSPA